MRRIHICRHLGFWAVVCTVATIVVTTTMRPTAGHAAKSRSAADGTASDSASRSRRSVPVETVERIRSQVPRPLQPTVTAGASKASIRKATTIPLAHLGELAVSTTPDEAESTGLWDGAVSVGPPETCKDRLTAMLLSCQPVVRAPMWRAAYIIASRPFVAEYKELAKTYGGGLWSVLVEEDLVPEFGNRTLKHLRPRQGWNRQQDVKLAFLARPGPANTILFDADSLCSCSQSWETFAKATAERPKLDMCVEKWSFEPARSNMIATAEVLGVSDATGEEETAALIGWTPQIMSRAMFREILADHRPGLLRELLEARAGPKCKAMNALPSGARLRGRCWTEYFV
jgi:hypothetical protein